MLSTRRSGATVSVLNCAFCKLQTSNKSKCILGWSCCEIVSSVHLRIVVKMCVFAALIGVKLNASELQSKHGGHLTYTVIIPLTSHLCYLQTQLTESVLLFDHSWTFLGVRISIGITFEAKKAITNHRVASRATVQRIVVGLTSIAAAPLCWEKLQKEGGGGGWCDGTTNNQLQFNYSCRPNKHVRPFCVGSRCKKRVRVGVEGVVMGQPIIIIIIRAPPTGQQTCRNSRTCRVWWVSNGTRPVSPAHCHFSKAKLCQSVMGGSLLSNS